MERPGGRISQSIRLIVCVTMWYKIPHVGLIFFFVSLHVCTKSEKQAEPVGYESTKGSMEEEIEKWLASDKKIVTKTIIHFNLK